MNEDLNMNPQNQKSMNLTLISRRNQRLNRWVFSENINHKITENKKEIKLNYNSKTKLNSKQR